MHQRVLLLLAAGLFLAADVRPPPLAWAFPGAGLPDSTAPETGRITVAGSKVTYEPSKLDDWMHAPDWFPKSHPPAPTSVLAGSGKAAACGYCHLPDGSGRIENADLRGLPVAYIEEQVHAFASGARRSADSSYAPAGLMAGVAKAVRPADLRAAALYFSALEPVSHTQVLEAATIPRATVWRFVYRFDRSHREALGPRIIEGPNDPKAQELRDPRTRYTAWVPLGAIARGRVIAQNGASTTPACVACHGANFAGIAGASPTYLVRQLAGFRSRSRNDPGAAPMQAEAARLSDQQIIDLSAYVASRQPWTRAEVPESILTQPEIR